nr:toll/interleukin-1 receptor domain-containing protein [Candidatus Sigynarchaeota archaeon]
METIQGLVAAYDGLEPFLVACHLNEDNDRVYHFIELLHNKGIRIWYDTSNQLAELRKNMIVDKIKTCSVFVVFLSTRSVANIDILNEIALAEGRYRSGELEMIPVYLEAITLPDDLKYTFSRIPSLNINDAENVILARVLESLKKATRDNNCFDRFENRIEITMPGSHLLQPKRISRRRRQPKVNSFSDARRIAIATLLLAMVALLAGFLAGLILY